MDPYYKHQHTFGPANPSINRDGTQLFGSAPYYKHQHMFGPAANGVNNKGQQLFGYSRGLGAVTGGSLTVGAVAATGVVALYVVPAIINVLVSNKVLGFENRLSTKKMTGRAAAVGAVMGAPLALIIGGALATQG